MHESYPYSYPGVDNFRSDGDQEAEVLWSALWGVFSDIESHANYLCKALGRMRYLTLLTYTRTLDQSERPEALQKFLEDVPMTYTIRDILGRLADQTTNSSADAIALMT
jgi:hypothetical protein